MGMSPTPWWMKCTDKWDVPQSRPILFGPTQHLQVINFHQFNVICVLHLYIDSHYVAFTIYFCVDLVCVCFPMDPLLLFLILLCATFCCSNFNFILRSSLLDSI